MINYKILDFKDCTKEQIENYLSENDRKLGQPEQYRYLAKYKPEILKEEIKNLVDYLEKTDNCRFGGEVCKASNIASWSIMGLIMKYKKELEIAQAESALDKILLTQTK